MPAKGYRTVARRYFEQTAVREHETRLASEQNKAIARRYVEDILNRGDLAAIDQLVAAAVAGHLPGVTVEGTEALKEWLAASPAPQRQVAIEDVIGEGDRVCLRWTASDGSTGMFLLRIAGGKITELWANANELKT